MRLILYIFNKKKKEREREKDLKHMKILKIIRIKFNEKRKLKLNFILEIFEITRSSFLKGLFSLYNLTVINIIIIIIL